MKACMHVYHATLMHTVGDLPEVCSADLRDNPQCCSRDYILQRLATTEEDFRAALREELQTRFRRFRDIAGRLTMCKQSWEFNALAENMTIMY